jgi:hypothetical protein
MIYSGANLIRNSGRQAEQVERLKVVEPVAPVPDASTPNQTALDDETHSALLRFARFVNKEKDQHQGGGAKSPPKKVRPKGVPEAYLCQIEIGVSGRQPGFMLDIYA